jgi:deoxycytidylate deaminase
MYNLTISDRDLWFVRLSQKLAMDSIPHAGARVCAIIAHRGEVLSIGYNSSKTHPFQAKYRKNPHAVFWHAETSAINNALKRDHHALLPKSSMYVLRLTTASNPAISMPCEGCTRALQEHDITRVLYTTGEGYIGSTPHVRFFTL